MLAHIGFILFSFHGRIGRRDFWLAWLITAAIRSGLIGAAGILDKAVDGITVLGDELGPLQWLVWFVTAVITMSIPLKRLHDRQKSAKWLLLWCLPIFSELMFIELGLLRGTRGGNEWGNDPLEVNFPIGSTYRNEPEAQALRHTRNGGARSSVSQFRLEPSFNPPPPQLASNAFKIEPTFDQSEEATNWNAAVQQSQRVFVEQRRLNALSSTFRRSNVLLYLVAPVAIALIYLPLALNSIPSTKPGAIQSAPPSKEAPAAQEISDLLNRAPKTQYVPPATPSASDAIDNQDDSGTQATSSDSNQPSTSSEGLASGSDGDPSSSGATPDDSGNQMLLAAIYMEYLRAKYCADKGYSFDEDDLPQIQRLGDPFESKLSRALAQKAYEAARTTVASELGQLDALGDVQQRIECYTKFQALLPQLNRPAAPIDEAKPF